MHFSLFQSLFYQTPRFTDLITPLKPAASLILIKACGMKTGLAISQDTPVEVLKEFLGEVDMFLVMTVHPGFGGQKLISEMLDKVRTLRQC